MLLLFQGQEKPVSIRTRDPELLRCDQVEKGLGGSLNSQSANAAHAHVVQ